jgi:hypothetical protein
MSTRYMIKVAEPALRFGYSQTVEDPRDGLTLFGPLDEGKTFGIRPAVIGTPGGIQRFWKWVERIQRPIDDDSRSRPLFPGFEAAFNVPFSRRAVFEYTVDEQELSEACDVEDRHQRVNGVVRLFSDKIRAAITDEEARADVWFVMVTEKVYSRCRPQSTVPAEMRIRKDSALSTDIAKRLLSSPSLYAELNEDAVPYRYQPHFHNQLKALLLDKEVPTQVIRESTLSPNDFLNQWGQPIRHVGSESEIAWNLSTAAFYKSGARPWKIASVRPAVCYLGLVFKRDETGTDNRYSSCGAQMFLDSGDGLVFKGTGGPWYSEETNAYHLNEQAAKQLVETAVRSYRDRVGDDPHEMFIHGKARFDDAEWRGFVRGASSKTRLVGVRIRLAEELRVYRPGNHAILRGLAYVRDDRTAYLWANGFVPRLGTYPGREVPKALLIDVCRGYDSPTGPINIRTVVEDVLALTKLNYNACIYGDGEPVTLRFADAVGEILTAGPVGGAPLPFKFYI